MKLASLLNIFMNEAYQHKYKLHTFFRPEVMCLGILFSVWREQTMNIKRRKNNEKLPEIPIQKQAVHRDRGRGTEPCLGVRDTDDMFLYECSTDIQGT